MKLRLEACRTHEVTTVLQTAGCYNGGSQSFHQLAKKVMSTLRSDNRLTNCPMPQRMKSLRGKDLSKSQSDSSLMSCRLPQRTHDGESQDMKNVTFEAPNELSTYLREDLPTEIHKKGKLRIRNEVLTIVCC
mmetsp:Transcript_5243/g.13010  ORF Transcript_5243/g.13010 Transcript_5243/m.13010 type:complete len:132 (-) Transcript_5243:66-461(-)